MTEVIVLPELTETDNSVRDLDKFTAPPTMNNNYLTQRLYDLRQSRSADMVVILTNGNYFNIGGRTKLIGTDEPNAFSIVQVQEAANPDNQVFCHELGHQFGGRHENDFPSDPEYSHAMDFDVRYGLFNWGRKEFNTIMRNPTKDRKLVLHFSNPNITYQGVKTGSEGCCNVARVIRENAPRIANFRTPINVLSASIIGTNYIYYSGTFYWEPSITCGTGPYTTQWDVLYPNGQLYSSQTVANDGLLRLDFYPYASITQYGMIVIRVTVRSSNNETTTSFMNVYIDPLDMYMVNPNTNNDTAQIAMIRVEGTELTSISPIFPNPATSKAYFDFVLNKEADVKVSLFDSQGKEVKSYLLGKKFKGHNQQEIDVANLNSGLYLCRIATNTSFITQKFTITH